MNLDEVVDVHICFRCGEVEGDYDYDPTSASQLCKNCGEHGVITVQQSMDILNELVLEERIKIRAVSETGYFDD